MSYSELVTDIPGEELAAIGSELAAGSVNPRDVKRRHWDIALGSAGESAAALDLIEIEHAATSEQIARAREHFRVTTLRLLGLLR